MAEPSSAAPAAAAALKMLKVKCSLEDCPVFFLRQGSRPGPEVRLLLRTQNGRSLNKLCQCSS